MLTEIEFIGRIDGLTIEELNYCVQQGWIAPSAGSGGIRYLEVDVARVRLIRELRFDLEIDEGSIPVLLSLLDQVHTHRRELRNLAEAVREQPEDVRERIAAAVRRIAEGR